MADKKPRETVAQKRTRIGMLLADLDARTRELSKLNAIVKGLKAQARDIENGAYGEWNLTRTAGREMLDQQEARRLLDEAGIPIPMTMTQPSLVLTPVVAPGAKK
jgi:hypothetical protein